MDGESMRRQGGFALTLAATAGFVDAVGFIVLRGLFTAHMSGNAAQVGVRLGQGNVTAATPLLVAIGLFVIGCALGELVGGLTERRLGWPRGAAVLSLQAALVAAFMLLGSAEVGAGAASGHGLIGFYLLAALAILSMGLQAAALTEIGGQTVRTTYISGVLTNLGQSLSRHASGDEDVTLWRTALLAAIAVSYLAGATAGSFLHVQAGIWAMGLPLAALIAMATVEWLWPRKGISAGTRRL